MVCERWCVAKKDHVCVCVFVGKMVCVKVMCAFVRAAAVRTFSLAPALQCHLLDIRRYCGAPIGGTKCARISCGALLTLMMLRGNIKACHFQLSPHKSTRVSGRLQTANYEESRACPKVTGPMTMQERQSTWRQKYRPHMSLGVKATII